MSKKPEECNPTKHRVATPRWTTTPTAMFDLRGLEESKSNDTTSYFMKPFQCTGKDLIVCHRTSDDSTTVSDTNNHYEDEDEQMRRLASWGTFATIGTNESIDNVLNLHNVESLRYDDDGNPIDPQLIEKSKLNRLKLQQQEGVNDTNQLKQKRSVKFAYPPITSLKECPRIHPDEVDTLFFSDEELATYEHDRRSTGVVDDVEIVAVSTSFSGEVAGTAATKKQQQQQQQQSLSTRSSSPTKTKASNNNTMEETLAPVIVSSDKATGDDQFTSTKSFRLKSLLKSSPRVVTRTTTSQQQRQSFSTIIRRRASFGAASSLRGGGMMDDEDLSSDPVLRHATTDGGNDNDDDDEPYKEKRLLKSVQIYLRSRSTSYCH
jgi:hypothetical protein